ncbi:MAG: hypothetical protein JGK04_08535 [Microcoleus sp. PH2017_39_LGB_O_B]|uniref:hypothetical protein n=1 Tax=unclassified Microcoleus TaxID=2642155 RepID=UPI001D990845|nr:MULTISPECIES: hypothetical protein [unclassified Microcoleus]MCC3447445.1 hypothetical protein [Microcoleus sp. PH2017_09_SFU_O_A]MCC3628481.1 hypothetical protein [Microcoleus sp. PH2017_39_LGB_O_B]MCC3640556.1 hypothetical protein [Microcoleus sp. PH2017_33_LGB_O_A]
MMQILLRNHDQSQRLKKITCTELRLPEVIEWQGRFYRHNGQRSLFVTDKQTGSRQWCNVPFYRECRGARLAKLIFTPAKD